jgi:uncharacterized protein with HEPN domain
LKKDEFYLKHIAQSIALIEEFTREGREVFFNSALIQSAVIRQFEIIGEATKRLSRTFCEANPEIPWEQVAGMRDVLIHDYFGVSVERVWQTIYKDLPLLKCIVAKQL